MKKKKLKLLDEGSAADDRQRIVGVIAHAVFWSSMRSTRAQWQDVVSPSSNFACYLVWDCFSPIKKKTKKLKRVDIRILFRGKGLAFESSAQKGLDDEGRRMFRKGATGSALESTTP